MSLAALGLGGNLQEGRVLDAAIYAFRLADDVNLLKISPLYRSAPWGEAGGGVYLNRALLLDSKLAPWALLGLALDIEKQLGRLRGPHYAPRGIDIDLLCYDGARLRTPGLLLPHPHLLERRFALQPLVDVWPEANLGPGLSARSALLRCPDAGRLIPAPGSGAGPSETR